MGRDFRIGLVGCGTISRKYLATLTRLAGAPVVACADLVPEKARSVASAHVGIRALSVPHLLKSPEIDLVLNLTVPAAHVAVSTDALQAGKHVFVEKPLATGLAAAQQVIDLAEARSLRVGCAPDTVLGVGVQTARELLDSGRLGTPTSALAFLHSPGPGGRHPNPAFFYQPGAGPLFDMGPYYLTALVTLLGPIRRVVSMARAATPQRHITEGPHAGLVIDVEVDTHVAAILEHTSGAISTLVTSYDAPGGSSAPRIEVQGSEGTMIVPDPNHFSGTVRVRHRPSDEWTDVPASAGYVDVERGIGILDLAASLRDARPHRASAELALHVLDAMESILAAARSGTAVELVTTADRPAAVPLTTPATR